jgi:hypothetical protein
VIDDESDQASINTSKDPETNQTAINKQIRNTISQFRILSYVGYTATPFANILIDSTIEDDLFPRDFIVSLKKPVSYIGVEEIFGSTDLEGNVYPGLPILRTIDEIDTVVLSTSKKGEENVYDELPPSLLYALDCFFVAGALRISRGQGNQNISMLVHGSFLQRDQEKVHKLIENQVRLRMSEINRNVERSIESFKKIKEEEFGKTTTQMELTIDKLNDIDFNKNLKFFLNNVSGQVILDNAASDRRLSFEEKFWGIVIGGNTLSRGLTIEGLTCSYFLRNSKMYDSLMQMGRWFGYRPGYLDLTRIFMTDDLQNNFFEMAIAENEIREEISSMAENNDRPIDLRIRIRQHPGMSVTAKNKMRTAVAVEYSFSGSLVQSRYISTEINQLAVNEKAVNLLIQNIETQGIKDTPSGFSNFRKSLLYNNVHKESILQFLDNFTISPANKRTSNDFLKNYIIKNLSITGFNVGILSQITEAATYTFSNGKKINLLNRTYNPTVKSELDKNAIYLRSLAVAKDEMIDLFGVIPDCPLNADDVSNFNGSRNGFSFIRKKYRPKDRPLLLIYSINPQSEGKDYPKGELEIAPIKADKVLFGTMFVFPEEKSISSGMYIVNSTV